MAYHGCGHRLTGLRAEVAQRTRLTRVTRQHSSSKFIGKPLGPWWLKQRLDRIYIYIHTFVKTGEAICKQKCYGTAAQLLSAPQRSSELFLRVRRFQDTRSHVVSRQERQRAQLNMKQLRKRGSFDVLITCETSGIRECGPD